MSPWLSRKRIFEIVTSGNSACSRAKHLADRHVRPVGHAARPPGEEHQLELPDLHLVTVRQGDLVDAMPVHIRAVQRPDVSKDVLARWSAGHLDVPPGHRDVVEEDVASGVATGRGHGAGEHVADADVGAGLEHEHPDVGRDVAPVDADVVVGRVDDEIVRMEHIGVLLPGEGRATGRAEVRVSGIAVPALGADDALSQ